MTTTAIALPKKTQLKTNQETDEAQELLDSIDEMVVETKEDIEFASENLREIKARKKILEAERTKVTQHLDQALRTIRGWFREPIRLLERCEYALKQKIDVALEEAQRKQDRALEKASQAAMAGQKKKARQALAEAGKADVGRVEGISVRVGWDYEIVDFAKVPRKYLTVDDTYVRELLRKKKGALKIPGLKIFSKNTIASRS